MQNISVYDRPGRSTWYVAYDCPLRARRINESSGIPINDPRGKLAAYAYAREKSMSGIMKGDKQEASRWENWVETWIKVRFPNTKTVTSYIGAWKFLSFFLRENKVATPRALTYQHAVDFILWRESQVKKQSGKKVSRNTALHNIKVLSRIMREGSRRGYCTGNPCFRIGEEIRPTPAPEKPEFTNEQVALVRQELARREPLGRPSDWMAIAFEIALHQSCRLSATQIPMERIDFENNTIRLHEKGRNGEPTVFTLPMHPGLRPLLLRLRDEGRIVTCTLPRFASRNFGRVMKAIGLPHTMHCTRVTGITRWAREGIPIQQAMQCVHHGSWAVHKVYQRLKPADVSACHAALDFSSAPVRALGSRRRKDVRPASETLSPALSSGR